ncbi:transferrin receptor protein 2-like isoform X2 [Alosa alosa]|uniref:transferrin receptor protein 2-like isoform X2 n=1 Tax=Alosa alosa TaxID=278164 RepID=UPI0020152386|nr:transferrin receptor protein 2-like isoform X2 [Alosa alosa]
MEVRFDEWDSASRLQERLQGQLSSMGFTIRELVGLLVLHPAHHAVLPLDPTCYSCSLHQFSSQLNHYSAELQARGLSLQWVFSARGDYSRADKSIQNSNIDDERVTCLLNTRIMRAECCEDCCPENTECILEYGFGRRLCPKRHINTKQHNI